MRPVAEGLRLLAAVSLGAATALGDVLFLVVALPFLALPTRGRRPGGWSCWRPGACAWTRRSST